MILNFLWMPGSEKTKYYLAHLFDIILRWPTFSPVAKIRAELAEKSWEELATLRPAHPPL
jgi:hypothetical protein